MSDSAFLDVLGETLPDGAVLRPMGDIDLSTSPILRYELSQQQQKSPDRLIIDLCEVDYMDSSGVATLIESMQVARRYGGKLILCCMREKVRSIFEIARLESVFTIADTFDEARTL